jgi:hypothetical protein
MATKDDDKDAAGAAKAGAGAEEPNAEKDAAEAKDDAAKDEAGDADAKSDAPKSAAKPATKPGARPAGPRPAAPRQGGGMGGLVPIVLVVGVAVVLGYVVLRGDGGSGGPPPPSGPPAVDESTKWAVGQTVELDITLKPTDRGNLSCASPDEVAGKHCQFDAPDKPSAKGNLEDDKVILKPYAVPNSPTRILAAGLWTDPGMSNKLPDQRFTVHCKFKLEGKVNNPGIRWDPKGPWRDNKSPWFAASVSGCSIKK